MSYISREAAYEAVDSRIKQIGYENDALVLSIRQSILDVPSTDVREVKPGHNLCAEYPSLFECSVCGWSCDDTIPGDTETYNFCPNCGADMRGKDINVPATEG